jgi:hypothetical protein
MQRRHNFEIHAILEECHEKSDARDCLVISSFVGRVATAGGRDVEELTPISGHPILATAALEAVKQWKYRPYVFNGQPVTIETQITVVFQCACIQTLPASGKVGASVTILGNNLSGTTSIAFNGTPATFTVISSTEIKTTVPSDATSGPVQVSGPGGTFSSNILFRVRP